MALAGILKKARFPSSIINYAMSAEVHFFLRNSIGPASVLDVIKDPPFLISVPCVEALTLPCVIAVVSNMIFLGVVI